MASGLTMMDHSVMPRSVWSSDRSVWTSDGRFLHQPPADLYTSVHVTRSIPAGTSFGPCVLQNTFYDTIAFIAQKSCDKRTKSYVFKVDPEAMRSSVLVLSWLRLVQAARNKDEQNTEAYLKAGQLHVRTTRDVLQDEELLVWYDPELSHLLGFSDMSTRGGPAGELRCTRCNQTFKNEHPYLAHCRFLCVQAKNEAWSREAHEETHAEVKKPRRVTDFHNIARDLEHKRCGSDDDAEVSSKKRKHEDVVYPKGRKSVLLEKTNISNDNNITQPDRDYHQSALDASASILKLKADRFNKTDHLECKNDASAERGGEARGNFTHDARDGATDADRETPERSSGLCSTNSAFSLVLSSGPASSGEQKSAFCKPRKRTSSESTTTAAAHLSSTTPPAAMVDVFTPRTVMGSYGNLMASSVLNGELQSARSAAQSAARSAPFHYAPEHWSRRIGAQLQSAASSLTVLPPTFTSFGVSVQNWCAKCNLSFRMTSDLVFHMRSHHKKEFAAESQVRRRREEKLTCPICHEYFRERHHLSRHMTSHN